MTPFDEILLRELQHKTQQLHQFKTSLGLDVQAMLDGCEWSISLEEGQDGRPLMAIRWPMRVNLSDPRLYQLAEQAEDYWGSIDFALFSGETHEPLRVFSHTLLDRRWRWRQSQF